MSKLYLLVCSICKTSWYAEDEKSRQCICGAHPCLTRAAVEIDPVTKKEVIKPEPVDTTSKNYDEVKNPVF